MESNFKLKSGYTLDGLHIKSEWSSQKVFEITSVSVLHIFQISDLTSMSSRFNRIFTLFIYNQSKGSVHWIYIEENILCKNRMNI